MVISQNQRLLSLDKKHYQYLLQQGRYADVIDGIFRNNSVLMIGYGLSDIDIQLSLDRIASLNKSQPPHFLLCVRGTKTATEIKRLSLDKNVNVIEYEDVFGFHNRVDDYIRGINYGLGNTQNLKRIRKSLRARIQVHYPLDLTDDGLFVWNMLFREGVITLSAEPQKDQLVYLEKSISNNMIALDYLLFVLNEQALDENSTFLSLLERAFNTACSMGVQTVFLVVGAGKRPWYLKK